MPRNSASRPMGICSATGLAPRRSTIISRPRIEVGADAVHLVDEGDARDAVLVGLPPHGLGLRLHAADRAEQGDGAVEHAQAALDLHGEVHVPGRVDDVDLRVAPGHGGRGRRDGDAALLLLRHPVHDGRAFVDLADLVRLAGVVQDALGRRGLAGVDVRHDADVAGRCRANTVACSLIVFLPCESPSPTKVSEGPSADYQR